MNARVAKRLRKINSKAAALHKKFAPKGTPTYNFTLRLRLMKQEYLRRARESSQVLGPVTDKKRRDKRQRLVRNIVRSAKRAFAKENA